MMKIVEISRLRAPPEGLRREHIHRDEPLVLEGLDWGSCTTDWAQRDYLRRKVGPVPVKIHSSQHENLSFIEKNFDYATMNFDDLVERAWNVGDGRLYYLRALGNDRRGREVADFQKHFPSIADDFAVPDGLFPKERLFSSVLRVSSPRLQLWTHYDVMDNILVQVVGRKRAILFSHLDADKIYPVSDKSAIDDLDSPDYERFPKLADATAYHCILEPGDALFIPALWYHNMKALDFSVAVNFFWKGLSAEVYDSKDPYGNRDPKPVVSAAQCVDKALNHLQSLPRKYRVFYGQRLAKYLGENVALDNDAV